MKQEEQLQAQSQEDILSAFQDSNNKNEMAEVLKELFDKGKINLIGDLTKDEIKLCTRIFMIADMKNIPLWKKGLTYFMELMISKDRKSRKEILQAISGYSRQEGFMNKMNPRNWGGNRI